MLPIDDRDFDFDFDYGLFFWISDCCASKYRIFLVRTIVIQACLILYWIRNYLEFLDLRYFSPVKFGISAKETRREKLRNFRSSQSSAKFSSFKVFPFQDPDPISISFRFLSSPKSEDFFPSARGKFRNVSLLQSLLTQKLLQREIVFSCRSIEIRTTRSLF